MLASFSKRHLQLCQNLNMNAEKSEDCPLKPAQMFAHDGDYRRFISFYHALVLFLMVGRVIAAYL